jgi:predicted N-acyltransferase
MAVPPPVALPDQAAQAVTRFDEGGQDLAVEAKFLAKQLEPAKDHVAFKCYAGETLVGFALAFPHEDTLYMRAVGFSYEDLQHRAEYFSLTYYLPVMWAARHGLTTIHLGTQALEPKIKRGAILSPLWHIPIGWSWNDTAVVAEENRAKMSEAAQW